MQALRRAGARGDTPRATQWQSVKAAAAQLDLRPRALQARCRRAARKERGHVIADLGMGVVARKFGRSWRVYVPSIESA